MNKKYFYILKAVLFSLILITSCFQPTIVKKKNSSSIQSNQVSNVNGNISTKTIVPGKMIVTLKPGLTRSGSNNVIAKYLKH